MKFESNWCLAHRRVRPRLRAWGQASIYARSLTLTDLASIRSRAKVKEGARSAADIASKDAHAETLSFYHFSLPKQITRRLQTQICSITFDHTARQSAALMEAEGEKLASRSLDDAVSPRRTDEACTSGRARSMAPCQPFQPRLHRRAAMTRTAQPRPSGATGIVLGPSESSA
jgi:hypothetical protein